MNKIKEMIIDDEYRRKTLDKARLLFTAALYLFSAGILMEHVSVPTLLKILGFMLAGQAFYFLWKSNKVSRF